MAEKGIPFTLETEVPWDSTTATPLYNPLEKLPILLVPRSGPSGHVLNGEGELDNSKQGQEYTSVFESHHVLDWIETKYPDPPMLPASSDQQLEAKEVDVVAGGMCDALVLRFFETQREPEKQSPEWMARQERKARGGVKWLADKVRMTGADGSTKFLVGDRFGLADIAAGSVLGYMDVRAKYIEWQLEAPELKRYFEGLMQRESFRTTVPFAQSFKDKIV